MTPRKLWQRDELIIAMNLYCKLPFGNLHRNTPIIVEVAEKLGRTSGSLAMKLCNLASLDPMHQARGIKGLSSVSKAGRDIWIEFSENWEKLGVESEVKFQNLMSGSAIDLDLADKLDNFEDELKEDLMPVLDFIDNDHATESLGVRKARIGQSFFRKAVLASYGCRCCITGNPIPELLIASHIIPWRKDKENRLNPKNGLCLARTHDTAFDRGLISLDERNTLLISKYLKDFLPNEVLQNEFMIYEGIQISSPEKFHPDERFLCFHRENIFLGF